MAIPFPFSAIVGQDEMKLAIQIVAIDPKVGGILALGDRGTGKSTAVRALEDAGYFCVDNLPPQLLPSLVDLFALEGSTVERAALVFDVRGGKEAAFRFGNALEVVKLSNNLGDAKSIVTHPATTTHQRIPRAAREEMGIGEGMLRLSIGLEDAEDLIADLGQALAQD